MGKMLSRFYFLIIVCSLFFYGCSKESKKDEVVVSIEKLIEDKVEIKDCTISDIKQTSVKISSNIAVTGGLEIIERGFIWSKSNILDIDKNEGNIKLGKGIGEFSNIISNLSSNTKYFVIAYAINKKGVTYSEPIAFTTIKNVKGVSLIPSIQNEKIDNILETSVDFAANITSDGGEDVTKRGILWSKSNVIDIDNNEGKIELGKGIGEFSTTISNLISNTNYFIVAYAINKVGISYGLIKDFTTKKKKAAFIEMVYVEGGTFQIGSNEGIFNDKPVHEVTVSSFEIAKFELTQAKWNEIMGKNTSFHKGDEFPVERVQRTYVAEFIKKLNQKTGKEYRLPTEAEWEFAARGGNMSKSYKYSGSNNVEEVAWLKTNSKETHKVGMKKPNELGIYDMSGNVFEFCSDYFSIYEDKSVVDPKGPVKGRNKIFRGGSVFEDEMCCRVSTRLSRFLGGYDIGFRLAISVKK